MSPPLEFFHRTFTWDGRLNGLGYSFGQVRLYCLGSSTSRSDRSSAGFSWMTAFVLILLFYTYAHYCFASVTARISAMYAAFIAVAAACGTPPLMPALTFGFFANCPISLTHYGNGCGPVYYGAGYVSQSEWWRKSFVICTMNASIWLTIGMAWWKIIGLY